MKFCDTVCQCRAYTCFWISPRNIRGSRYLRFRECVCWLDVKPKHGCYRYSIWQQSTLQYSRIAILPETFGCCWGSFYELLWANYPCSYMYTYLLTSNLKDSILLLFSKNFSRLFLNFANFESASTIKGWEMNDVLIFLLFNYLISYLLTSYFPSLFPSPSIFLFKSSTLITLRDFHIRLLESRFFFSYLFSSPTRWLLALRIKCREKNDFAERLCWKAIWITEEILRRQPNESTPSLYRQFIQFFNASFFIFILFSSITFLNFLR